MSDQTLGLTVIGGMLGAGKTTLVNQLLRRAAGRRLAILVNEFGDLPIDADLIEAEDDSLISLTGGCVCCSFGDDLGGAIAKVRAMDPAPDHLILEASGVALPGSVAMSLELLPGIDVQGVVVLADTERIKRQLCDPYLGDTVKRQMCDSDVILLTKIDLVTPEDVAAAESSIRETAPLRTALPALGTICNPEFILKHFERQPSASRSDPTPHALFHATVMHPDKPLDVRAYANALARDPSVIRAKGHLEAESGQVVLLQLVGDRVSIAATDKKVAPGVVEIRLTP